MPAERLVFEYEATSHDHASNVFHHSDYVRRVWGRLFEIHSITPRASVLYQTMVVLRKAP